MYSTSQNSTPIRYCTHTKPVPKLNNISFCLPRRLVVLRAAELGAPSKTTVFLARIAATTPSYYPTGSVHKRERLPASWKVRIAVCGLWGDDFMYKCVPNVLLGVSSTHPYTSSNPFCSLSYFPGESPTSAPLTPASTDPSAAMSTDDVCSNGVAGIEKSGACCSVRFAEHGANA